MLLEDIPVRVHCRKYRDGYALQYFCPLKGIKRQVSHRKSGFFSNRKEALAWASEHLKEVLDREHMPSDHQRWRLNSTLVKQYNEYAEWRKAEFGRSALQELSILINFVFPFFVTVSKANDPNRWGELGEEFSDWLRNDAKTRYGKPLAISTGNRAISVSNQFLKWMRRKKYINYSSYRPFESFDARKMPKRNHRDLVPDETFESVYEFLKARSKLYADLWYVQRRMGFRVNELLGLAFNWVSDQCPNFIKEEFEAKGQKVFGSIYLESQPAKQYIKRVNGVIPRAPLKWRTHIGPDFARTIPIIGEELWNIFLRRYESQCELWDQQKFGKEKESYLLFDKAQVCPYRDLIREAYESLGLESSGTHVLRHTLSTEWTALKISEKVSELVLGHKADAHQLYVHIVGQVNSERLKAAPMPRFRKNVEN